MSANVYHNTRDMSQTFANALHHTFLGGTMELYIKEIAHISQQLYCEELHGGDHPQAIVPPDGQHGTVR